MGEGITKGSFSRSPKTFYKATALLLVQSRLVNTARKLSKILPPNSISAQLEPTLESFPPNLH
jgi:hypothetical protein